MSRFSATAIATILMLFTALSFAKEGDLSAKDREHLLKVKEAPLVTTMHEIPSEVVQACATTMPGEDFRLADAGQPFQVTDVVTNDTLLGKRLIWAAHLPGYWVVHYEKGGIAHTFHILVVADASAKKTQAIWSAMVPPSATPLKSYGAFRDLLAAGKL